MTTIAEITQTHRRQDGPVHRRLQEQPDQDPHRPRQPGAAGYGACRLLRLVGAAVSQVANVSLLDARTISVQPWEKGMGAKIEKAIRESDLGLNPASMGDLIRVPMPPMSEERRKEMTKLVRTEGENAKIADAQPAPRRQRRVKKLVKDKLASEDDQKRAEAEIQKVTDRHIAEIDQLVAAKEAGDHGRLRPVRSSMTTGRFPTTSPSSWTATAAGPRGASCRAWPATSRASNALRALRQGLRRSRRRRADGVRLLFRELEPSGRGSVGPDGPAGRWRSAREVPQLQPRRRAPALRRRARRPVRQDARRAWCRPKPPPPHNTRLVLNVCFNYGGRWDIAQAAAQLAARGEPITEASLDARDGAGARARPRPVHPHRRRAAAVATSCCGRAPTPSCSSATSSGPSSTRPRWTRPSPPTGAASAASARPPRSWPAARGTIRRPPEPPCSSNASSPRSSCWRSCCRRCSIRRHCPLPA